MSTFRNRVQLVGNLGMDPEMVNFENGKKLAKFTLATNESYSNGDGKTTKETQWHNIVAWGKNAEIAEQGLRKGQEVAVEGKICYRQYQDKNDQTRYVTEILIDHFVLYPAAKRVMAE